MRTRHSLSSEQLLRAIDEGVAGETGANFFRVLVSSLVRCLDVVFAFASEFGPDLSVAHPIAEWRHGELVDHPEPFEIAETPCRHVLKGDIVGFEAGICDLFPCDQDLSSLALESYLAIPLKLRDGAVLGHLAVCDSRPREWNEHDHGILRIFGARAAAEIDRRRAHADLTRALKEAADANAAKSEFLARMSHELRTPLNGVLGYTQLLARDSDLNRHQRESVSRIAQCGEHLLGLVDEVLDIARIEAGRCELSLSEFDIRRFVEEIAGIGQLRAEQAGLEFRLETPSTWPASIVADEQKLRQILLNLLSNATRFTPQGSITFRVRTRRPVRGRWHFAFEFADTGIGIAPAEIERVFEPFYRTEAGWRLSEGSGLGLSITKNLVNLMNGEIGVRSTVGTGNHFRVELGFEEPARRPRPRVDGARIVGYRGRKRRLLLVDDDAQHRNIVREMLEPLGFRIFEVDDGAEAAATIARVKPHLVLLDLVMPGTDGFEVMHTLRQGKRRTVPVIALSASVYDHTQARCRLAGCAGFIGKPVRFEHLVEALERHLELTWVYADDVSGDPDAYPATGRGGGAFRDELDRIYALARQGDVTELVERLDLMRACAPGDRRIVDTVRALTRRYDMKGIRDYLGPMLE